jgi:hypothetical protein
MLLHATQRDAQNPAHLYPLDMPYAYLSHAALQWREHPDFKRAWAGVL